MAGRRCPLCGRLPLRVLAVSIGTACKLIGLSRTSWYKLETLGLAPAVSRRKGMRPRVRVTALEAWLRRGEGGDDDR